MDENKKYYYEQYILNCLENANEQQARMIYIFAYYHMMKNVKVREPNIGDREWLIMHQIFDILQRNSSEWFLRKALTRMQQWKKFGARIKKGYCHPRRCGIVSNSCQKRPL